MPLLTPDLVTEGEIDWHIDALKNDLEAIRMAAKKALKKAEAENRDSA